MYAPYPQAARQYLERIHRRGCIVSYPDEASLFLVPIDLAQMHGCLWEPQVRYRRVLAST